MNARLLAGDVVAGVIQRIYGDGTQTVLDRRCAREIVDALLEAGWCPPDVLGSIIASAGGQVDVTRRSLADPPRTLTQYEIRDLLSRP